MAKGFILLCFLAAVRTLEIHQDILENLFDICNQIPLKFLDKCPDVSTRDVAFYLYDREHKTHPVILTRDTYDAVNLSRETKLIIHGMLGNAMGPEIIDIKNSYMRKGDYNVITVEWWTLAFGNYSETYCNAPYVAKKVAEFIHNANLDLNNTHVIGQSLGGQIAGLVGESVQELTFGRKIKRITGLDAAGPLYSNRPDMISERLSADDAQFVDAIHTNGLQLGYDTPYGTVDFYVNGGRFQVGCPVVQPPTDIAAVQENFEDIECSHNRGMQYFTESINYDGFIATRARMCSIESSCSPLTAVMGENCPSNVTGRYNIEIIKQY